MEEEENQYKANLKELYYIKEEFCICEIELLSSFGYSFDIRSPYDYLGYFRGKIFDLNLENILKYGILFTKLLKFFLFLTFIIY